MKKLQGKAVRVWAWEVKRQVGILRGKMHSLAWPVHAWHVGAVTSQSGCKAHAHDGRLLWYPAKVSSFTRLLDNSLKMWQQQMTSNHNSSQITQITSLQKKIVSYKSQERRKGSRLDLIFGKTRQRGRTFLQTMDKRWDVYFLKHKNWRTFLQTMDGRWPKSHLAPAEKDLALQHRGRGSGRCRKFWHLQNHFKIYFRI